MGISHRRFNSARKGKFAQKRIKRVRQSSVVWTVIWALLLLMALLFFVTSFCQNCRVGSYFDDLAKIALILLAMGMVFISFRDKREKIIEKRRKKKLKSLLAKQRKTLQNHFDLQKKLAANSSLNFVVNLADTLEKEKEEETIASAKAAPGLTKESESITPNKALFSQINLAQTVIDGEDVSSFPPEWQKFFIENEGKPPVEKLNKMLAMSNNESKNTKSD